MYEDDHSNRGIIDASNRIISELLKKTTFKENLKAFEQNIDPDNSPELIRTLLWQDVEVPMGLASMLPVIANSFIKAFDEASAQIMDKFPEPLLQGFVRSLADEIDKESLCRLVRNMNILLEQIRPVLDDAFASQKTKNTKR